MVGTRRAGVVAVVLAALTMRLGYDAATWTRVQHSLYRYSAVTGGPLEVETVVAAVVFGARARGLRGGRLATVGAACLVVALALWFAVVNTANAEMGRWAVDGVPSDCVAGGPRGSSGTPAAS